MLFFSYSCYLALLRPSILFSNTPNLSPSLNVRDQVSHLYKTTSKIAVLYTLIFIYLDSKLEDKILHREIANIP